MILIIKNHEKLGNILILPTKGNESGCTPESWVFRRSQVHILSPPITTTFFHSPPSGIARLSTSTGKKRTFPHHFSMFNHFLSFCFSFSSSIWSCRQATCQSRRGLGTPLLPFVVDTLTYSLKEVKLRVQIAQAGVASKYCRLQLAL